VKVGYARVSTEEQSLEMQIEALERAGCERIVSEKAHADEAYEISQEELERLIESLDEGDVLVVWKLDRMSRSLLHFSKLVLEFEERGISFRSITEHLDTSNPAGRLMVNILVSFAQYEREIIRERTKASLANAKRRGVKLGRKHKLNAQQRDEAFELYKSDYPVKRIARIFGVNRMTIYRIIKRMEASHESRAS